MIVLCSCVLCPMFLCPVLCAVCSGEADETAIKKKISLMFSLAHLSVSTASGRMLLELRRHNYVTPTNYLELVRG